MEIKRRLAKVMYFFFAISFFLSAMAVFGGAMTLLFIFVWPFNKALYRKIISYFGYTMFAQAVFMMRYWSTTDLKLYIDKDVYEKYLGKEHSLCILNHSGELDWIAMIALLDRLSILGNAKGYVKNTAKLIPFVGWGVYCCEFIYLSRSFEKDKIILQKSVQDLCEYENPITILLFPEGTRFSPKKHEEGLKFSRERGFKEMQHHLVPRTKGFTTSVPYMKGKIPALYDIVIAFEGEKPTISNMIKAGRFNVHMYLRRIPMENVPDTEKEQDQYLRELFYQKDEHMESFKKTGNYFQLTNQKPLEPISIAPTMRCFYNMILWFIVTLSPISYFLIKLFINGQFIYFTIFITCIGLSFGLLAKLIDTMEMKDINKKNNNLENGDKIKLS